VYVREARLEVPTNRVAGDPGFLVWREVTQVDEEEPLEHEARHDEQSHADVVATGLHW
jgi:hypothetical protein